ncbi:MAG: hypothetical protein KAY82_01345 [Hylemonella sp.]|jgi:hypothetical protein|nr:hypothetical protein [Hylemonella sp.]
MKKSTLSAICAAFSLAMGTAAAAPMTSAEYKAGKDNASAKYTTEKAACKSLAGNTKDICMQEAKGQEKISKAELEESYAPSEKHRFEVRMAKADAAYAVSKEKCDDQAGNAKDVCRKEAKSAFVTAKADAKVVEKSNDANAAAREKSADVRKEAAEDKSDAAYAVAKEKCDALAKEAKTTCLKDAKVFYGKL